MSRSPTVLILGASGNTGSRIARLLLAEVPEARVVAAGRRSAPLEALAGQLGERCTPLSVDASSRASMEAALRDVDLLVAASSTSEFVDVAIEACLATGTDYLDIQLSAEKVARLFAASDLFEAADLCAITDAGFHPGVPAALIRYGAERVPGAFRAQVSSVIQIDWRGLEIVSETAREMVREFADYDSKHLVEGSWRSMSWTGRGSPRFDFGPPWGEQVCVPMFLEELRPLPQMYPQLTSCGFYVGGFDPITDYLVIPLVLVGMKLLPGLLEGPLARLLCWSLRRGSRPPFGTLLRLEVQSEREQLVLQLGHEDGYDLTAIPVAAWLLQWADGSRPLGVSTMAQAVEPARLLGDLQRMGVRVSPPMEDSPPSPDGTAQPPRSDPAPGAGG